MYIWTQWWRRGVRFLEEWGEWRLPGRLYADDLALCGESEEDLRTMVGRFVELCRSSLKVNAGKSKMMVLNGDYGLECDAYVDRFRLEQGFPIFLLLSTPWHFYRFLCTPKNEEIEKNYIMQSGWRLHHLLYSSGYYLWSNLPLGVHVPQFENPWFRTCLGI